jgi:hypothetical protein
MNNFHRYNGPRLLTAMIEGVTCRSKSKMAAIQGKHIRNGIGKTMFFSLFFHNISDLHQVIYFGNNFYRRNFGCKLDSFG